MFLTSERIILDRKEFLSPAAKISMKGCFSYSYHTDNYYDGKGILAIWIYMVKWTVPDVRIQINSGAKP
jgi:hypothetical protein